jgi:signal transduction histidine kinase
METSDRSRLKFIMPSICGAVAAIGGLGSGLIWFLMGPLPLGAWAEIKTPMGPIDAILFMTLGCALVAMPRLRVEARRAVAAWVGGGVALFSALCILAAVFQWRIDLKLWPRDLFSDANGGPPAGAITPMGAANFCLVGLGLALMYSNSRRRAHVGQSAAVIGLLLPAAALTSHLYQWMVGILYAGTGLYQIGPLRPISFDAALDFLILITGILCLRPRLGFAGILTASNIGGVMARRLLLTAIVLPPLLCFFCIAVSWSLMLGVGSGAGLLVTLTGLTIAATAIFSAGRVEKIARSLEERGIELEIARREAESANRIKSEFLANMSHELRTPMNAVIGFSEIMRDARFGPIADCYREYATDIYDSGVHLLSVINQILDLAKIEARQLSLNEDLVSLPEIAQVSVTLVKERARLGGLTLALDIPDGDWMVRADETRLKQILLNLLSNAVKFTGKGGTVALSFGMTPERDLEISIADTGIGMDEQQLLLALMPFRQVDSSISRQQEGSGLGLPLAKALCEQHGGGLSLESQPGVGTIARVRLPGWRVVEGSERPVATRLAVS